MLTKTLANLHIYINADYKIDNLSRWRLYLTPEHSQMVC